MSSRLIATTVRRSVAAAIRPNISNVFANQAFRSMKQSPAIRFYSQKITTHLKEVLENEIGDAAITENKLEEPSSEFVKENGFSVVEKPGEINVELVKKTGDNEIVHVFFDADDITNSATSSIENEESFEEEVEALDQIMTGFKVVIENTEAQTAMVVDALLEPEAGIIVDQFYVEEDASTLLKRISNGDYSKSVKYQGPPYSSLDESLQIAFEEYLASKGINHELSEFILSYSEFKEENEYRKWLKTVQKFF